MQYPDSVEYLYALGNELKSVKLGLDRIRTLLEALGNPQRRLRVVHVAGTNGKGSTCAMIAAGLQQAGFHTGLYTSPHLVEPTERIRIQGEDLPQTRFVEVFREVHETAENMVLSGEMDMHPSYFETVTAMGFLAFAQQGVEWAVVEVGLGGRLDATNVVEPALTVVTPVDYDHEAWLGSSIEAIAGEKAGILKPATPALFAQQRPDALAVLESRARALHIESHLTGQWRIDNLEYRSDGSRFVLTRQHRSEIPSRIEIVCPLRGAWQVENARTAAAALDLLGLAPAAIEQGIAKTRWPGRLERLSTRPEVFVDGAHNPSGCAALAQYIRSTQSAPDRPAGQRTWLIFGVMRDKAVSEIAALLFPLADELILTAPQQRRALRPEALASELAEYPPAGETAAGAPRVHLAGDLDAAMALLATADPKDRVFIAGSLYLAGEAKAWFAKRDISSENAASLVE